MLKTYWIVAFATVMTLVIPRAANAQTEDAYGKFLFDHDWEVSGDNGYVRQTRLDPSGQHYVGGTGRLCDPDEFAYVCDKQTVVMCMTSSSVTDHLGSEADPLFGCQAVNTGKVGAPDDPTANMLYPPAWLDEHQPKYDAALCGCAQGAGRDPCQYLKAYHRVENEKQVLQYLNQFRGELAASGYPRRSSSESAATTRGDWKSRCEVWASNHKWKPNDFGNPLPGAPPPPVKKTEPPPPAPAPVAVKTNQCGIEGDMPDCSTWNSDHGQSYASKVLAYCKSCTFSQCASIYKNINSRFTGQPNQKFLDDNQITSRATAAANSIQKFLQVAQRANMKGTFFDSGNGGDIDHCFFPRIVYAVGDWKSGGGEGGGKCKVSDRRLSLTQLRTDLQGLAAGKLDGVDASLAQMGNEFRWIKEMQGLKDNGQHFNASYFLKGVPGESDGSELDLAAKQMLEDLYHLEHTNGTLRFDAIVSNSDYNKNFAEVRTIPYTDAALRDEVRKMSQSCVGYTNETSATALQAYGQQFKKDLETVDKLSCIEQVCNPNGNSGDFAPGSPDKYNNGRVR